MNHKAISFILEIIMLSSAGTLLFFISEIVLGSDIFFAHHPVVIAVASIFIMLWSWCQDRRNPTLSAWRMILCLMKGQSFMESRIRAQVDITN